MKSKIHPKALICRALLVSVALSLTACDQIFEDRAARSSERADKKSSEGDFQGAIVLYEQAIDGTEKTAELHYKLAMIYDDKLNDTISAIHHFHRYLALAPKGGHVKDVNSILKQDELKLVTFLNQGGTMTQKDAANLKNINLALQKKNAELKEQARFSAQSQQPHTKGKTVEAQQKPIPPGVKTYVVAPGDTLASISRKFYNGPGHWKDIQDANFNTLEGTAKLKPGMTLMIP